MPCPRCGALLLPAAAFCGWCGVANGGKTCPRCSTPNESGSRFCSRCGMALEGAPRTGAVATPEGRPGGFWPRLGAWLIDGLITGLIQIVPIAALFGDTAYAMELSDQAGSLILLAIISIPAAYHTIGNAYWGRTLGKAALGMRVIGPRGRNPGLFRAFFRWLALTLSVTIFAPVALVIAFEGRKRGLHDLICETRVVIR